MTDPKPVTYYAHRFRGTKNQFLNAPHIGARLFYTRRDALAYLDSPEFPVVRVTITPDSESEK